ncbi:hypothetical protein [Paraglaciecola psychrophila]|uniref:hypothetical protein n=1 Tax=Paraglaciecola psychrophila TaxID=326544 RepID=UPI0005544C6B|nr:hypothetical protein [Paraglaciecola psychrophila]
MQNPLYILVKTWLQLLQFDLEHEAKKKVENKIVKAFGSIEIAIIFCKRGLVLEVVMSGFGADQSYS